MKSTDAPTAKPKMRVFVVTHEGTAQCVVAASGPIQAAVLAVDALRSQGVTDEVLAPSIESGWPTDEDVTEVETTQPNAITLD